MLRGLAVQCYIRDNWKCRHCQNRDTLTPHHLIYKSKGGEDRLDNLLTLCLCCHSAAHDKKLLIDFSDLVNIKFTRVKGWKPA